MIPMTVVKHLPLAAAMAFAATALSGSRETEEKATTSVARIDGIAFITLGFTHLSIKGRVLRL